MTDLLKLHPIGSEVSKLIHTLEQAGAKPVKSKVTIKLFIFMNMNIHC